jgi:hypothetical protein
MEYPNSGSLWPTKNRSNEKAPNIVGDIKMESALLQELLNKADGGLVEIRLAGWTRTWEDKKYISLKASAPQEKTPKKEDTQGANDDRDIPF